MKKSLLLATALVSGLGLMAQNGKHAVPKSQMAQKVTGFRPIADPGENLYPMGYSPKVSNPNKVLVGPPYPYITSTRNVFGTQTSEISTLSYNKDLNCVVLVSRMPPASDWTFPTIGAFASGYMTAHWTTDNGQTWDSTLFYKHDTQFAGRHPEGVISNPAGNTNVTQARFVAAGAGTDNGSVWNNTWFASTLLDGSLGTNHVQTTNDQQVSLNTVPGNLGYNNYFTYSMCENSGTVWTLGLQVTTPGTPSGTTGYNIFKGAVGATGVTWSQDMTTLNGPTTFHTSSGEADCSAGLIAFGPDKMTGYILAIAADANASTYPGAAYGFRPMVWKTTDAGATWNHVNAGFNWENAMPAAWGNLRSNTTNSWVAPTFLNVYGGDIAVDANGKLHYVTAASSQFSDDADSLGYTYTFDFGYTQSCDKPWIIDFTTDGNGSWNGTFIDYLNTAKMGQTAADTTSDANPWADGSGGVYGYDARIQITRSTDGTKIFYSWNDSDTINSSSQPTKYNLEPNIMYQGYDVMTNTYTATKAIPYANTNTGLWFPCISDFCIDLSSTQWQIPMMYTESRGQTFNGGATAEDYYVDDATVDASEFTVAPRTYPVCPLFVGINEAHANIASIGNYPNPFSNSTTIKVELVSGDDITVNVFNAVGQTVATKSIKGFAGENNIEFNAANLSEGMYYYSVKVGNSVVTKKMVIQK